MKELVELFLAFARIGGLTFGGGYAMLPMLQREVVENKKTGTKITRISAKDTKKKRRK